MLYRVPSREPRFLFQGKSCGRTRVRLSQGELSKSPAFDRLAYEEASMRCCGEKKGAGWLCYGSISSSFHSHVVQSRHACRQQLPRCSIFDLRFLSPLHTAFDTRPALDDSDESPTSRSCKMPPGASHTSYKLSELSWGVSYTQIPIKSLIFAWNVCETRITDPPP
jgi:hypothetical protein